MPFKRMTIAGTAIGAVILSTVPFPVTYAEAAPDVATLPATAITSTSATLHGHQQQTLSDQVSAWFEYGTGPTPTFSAGSQTIYGAASKNSDFDFTLTGLTPGTTYQYRAVAQNFAGNGYGSLVSFTTAGTPPPPPPQPILSVSPQSFAFAAQVGTDPLAQTLTITNAGGGTMNWTVSDDAPWLNLSPASGVNSGTVIVTVISSSLAVGTFTGAITVVAGTAAGSPQLIPATLTVTATAPPPPPPPPSSGGGTSGGGGGFQAPTQPPAAATKPATDITGTGATIHGVVNPNGAFANSWFEWGPTTAVADMLFLPAIEPGTVITSYARTLTGLTPATTYYFRIAAQNLWTAYGDTLSFTTAGKPSTTTVPVPDIGSSQATSAVASSPVPTPVPPAPAPIPQPVPQTGGGTGQLLPDSLVLEPSADPSAPRAGTAFTYRLIYRNTDLTRLITDAAAALSIPKNITFESVNKPRVAGRDSEFVFDLGALPPGGEDTLIITARVIAQAHSDDPIVIGATVDYLDIFKRPHSVSTYLGLAVGIGGFFAALFTLFGSPLNWLLILLLLLILALIIYYLYRKELRKENAPIAKRERFA